MRNQPFLFRNAPMIPNASKDYSDFVGLLIIIDSLLEKTRAEKRIIEMALAKADPTKKKKSGWVERFNNFTTFVIRCNILRRFQDNDYRAFSVQSSDSIIIQWFLRRGQIEGFTEEISGKGLSKSSLERYDKIVSAEDIEIVVREICAAVSSKGWAGKMPGWNKPLSVRDIFIDCTCLESNIHFPVDWVLLRDAVRTLVLAINCLRQHGLRHRIRKPEIFLRQINQLCIEMSAASRKNDSKKKRKKVLRKMKAVVACVRKHATRYRDLLCKERESRTDLTEAEAAQILGRIDNIVTQLPAAIKQAEDRIIREQKIVDSDKILNLYEPHIHTIFRGKAGAAVEFGNTLYIAESQDGLIVDFRLYRDRAPADCKMLEESLVRCTQAYGKMDSVTADRGFHSPDNTALLSKEKVINNILPKSPRLMMESLSEPSFRVAHKRRAQTEGRIGILKNVFIGDHLSGKGIEHQQIEVGWSILVHNFWVLARLAQEKAKSTQSSDSLEKSA